MHNYEQELVIKGHIASMLPASALLLANLLNIEQLHKVIANYKYLM